MSPGGLIFFWEINRGDIQVRGRRVGCRGEIFWE